MKNQPVILRRHLLIAGALLALLLLIAAAINVPWAITHMRSRATIGQVPMATEQGVFPGKAWPSTTPHENPWPAPTVWSEGGVFGCRVYNVRSVSTAPGNRQFLMSAQHLGWPFPVVEVKQMWWDWDDPALQGPEPDPAPSLVLRGLVLNPILIGGGVWMILVLPWLTAVIAVRIFRRRRNRCLDCGYPAMSGSDVCTECGGRLNERVQ